MGRDPVRAHAISIHAPARGATFILDMRIRQFLFQSTLPRGERPGLDRARLAEVRFQSTLPRGERLSPASSAPLLQNFNPRSREGSDRGLRDGGKYGINISIHAPARGATMLILKRDYRSFISIHAPARGATGGGKRKKVRE